MMEQTIKCDISLPKLFAFRSRSRTIVCWPGQKKGNGTGNWVDAGQPFQIGTQQNVWHTFRRKNGLNGGEKPRDKAKIKLSTWGIRMEGLLTH